MIPVLPFPSLSSLGWAPWQEMQRLQAEIDQLVAGSAAPGGEGCAPLRVWSEENGLRLELEVPGIAPEQIELSIENDVLKLAVHAPPESASEAGGDEQRRALRRERLSGSFEHSLRLPYRIEAERVSARCEHGLLHIELPRPERDQARRIDVRGASATSGSAGTPAS
jgi:HSP20 family protein